MIDLVLGMVAILFRVLFVVFLWAPLVVALTAALRSARESERARVTFMPADAFTWDALGGETPQARTHIAIGRGATDDVILPDPSVSMGHAAVWLERAQWWVRDNASDAGTFLNGTRLANPRLIRPGDLLEVGPFRLRFEEGSR